MAEPDAAMEEHGPEDDDAMAGGAPETPLAAPGTPPAHWPMPDTPTTIADDLSEPGDDLPMMTGWPLYTSPSPRV